MHTRHVITSTANPRLKHLRRLETPRRRRQAARFVIEGYRLLGRALEAGASVETVFAAPELFLGEGEAALVEQARRAGAEVHEVAAAPFAAIAGQRRPDGLLAVVRRWPTDLARLRPVAGPPPLVVVAEAVERPGNLGTIVRTACAAGATGLVACDPQTDLLHPKTVTASVGAVFRLPVAASSTAETLAWLREHGLRIVVASPAGDVPLWRAELTGPVALVLGCEKRGVSSAWLEAADEIVAIPMPGEAMDSLNVAVAAGIVLFEAARQRLAAART
jgi:TrmH family RNA methyltransferase